MLKKILIGLIWLSLSASVSANNCIDHIKSKIVVWDEGKELNLDNCSIQDKDVSGIIQFLKTQADNSIIEIELNSNKISDQGLLELLSFLKTSHVAYAHFWLNAANNQISDVSAAELAKTTFQGLDLSNDNISDMGVMLLAENQAIEALYLENNRITDIGVASLAQDHNLRRLDLKNNLMTDTGAYVLSRRLYYVLDVSNNQIGANGINALEYACNNLQTIDNLFDDGNPGKNN